VNVLIDENLPPRWKEDLASFDIPAKHWTEIGNAGDPDELLFTYARQNGFTIITQDLDFSRMLAFYGTKIPSVIQLRIQAPVPEVVGEMVITVLKDHSEHLEKGCLISLDGVRKRFRLLPFE
jgi:predicted nuclease of predicted toxin-antitoxin system